VPPTVDVGVVTWNTAELTVAALRHLLDGEQGCELRVLVHDNGSTDGTVAALAEQVPEAEVEAGEHNLGFARGMNRLMARSSSPWFFALNSDAWPEDGALQALLENAERRPRSAAVAPLLLRPDGAVEHSTHPFPSLSLAMLEATGGRRWMPRRQLERLCLEGAWQHDRSRDVDWAVGAALLMRREALDEIGGFDERFFMYVEDLEWCWRARAAGWQISFEPDAVVRHVGNASGEKRWGGRRSALEAANLRVFLPEALGPVKASSYRALQAVSCAEQFAVATLRGRNDEAQGWRRQVAAHLGLVDPPPVDRGAHPGHRVTAKYCPSPTDAPGARGIEGDGSQTPVIPRVAVVVPTCGRSDRLARLIRALETQTISPEEFEVLVVNDGSPDDTAQVLEKLAADSFLSLRVLHNDKRCGPAAARNRGWMTTRAEVVAFTDDDCVPDPNWLSAGLRAIDTATRAVVGRTTAPPDQLQVRREPFSRFVEVDSVNLFETCNVFYRRQHLEEVGGFDERFRRPSGEDTHLGLAVKALGVEPVFAPEALVHHDVRPGNLREALRESLRWADLPLVIRGRPGARRELVHRWVFWKGTHPPAILAGVGILLALRWRPALVLVAPWVHHRLKVTPVCDDPRKALKALPGALALDLCEVATMARGSWRHRTILL
jgi:GT2 family glycosyltransferase